MKGRNDCVLDIHPTTVAVAIDKATITLEFLAAKAEERGDELGKNAWLVAKDQMAKASDAFLEARKVQSNRRNAKGNGAIEYASEELRLRFVLKTILDLLDDNKQAIGVIVHERAREILAVG